MRANHHLTAILAFVMLMESRKAAGLSPAAEGSNQPTLLTPVYPARGYGVRRKP